MSTRDIQGHLEEIYAVEVSPSLISEVTEAVMEEVRAWQSRPLDPAYPIVYLDALIVKMRQEGRVENRAVFVALGVNLEGHKEVLGLWTSATEGAKLWLQILTPRAARRESASKGRIGPDRAAQPRRAGHSHRLRGRTERISRCYSCRVSEGASAVMHRASGAQQPELRELERTQGAGFGSEADLSRRYRRTSRAAAERVRGPLGCQVLLNRQDLAAPLGRCGRAVLIPARNPKGDLYHQRGGIAEHDPAQGDQNAGFVSQ
jgi:putative transposase